MVVLLILLATFGGRYGLHRDEWYFVAAGGRPAFGYADQPPLVPLLARAWYDLVGGQIWAFRLVPAAVGAFVPVIAALTAREFGLTRGEQVMAAGVTASMSALFVISHLFSTTVFDVALTSACVWLFVRSVNNDAWWSWLLAGLVLGIALEVKLIALLVVVALVVGVIVAGPRQILRRPAPWLGAGIAALIALPNVWWQATNGWPQLALSAAIAAGGSGTSSERWLIVPFQVLLLGPPIFVVAIAGLRALVRDPRIRAHRYLAVAVVALVLLVTVTGGKPYYLLGLAPAVLAAGAAPTTRWLRRGGWRPLLAGGLAVVQLAISMVIGLPLLPPDALEPVVAVNYDAGEQVGWPALVDSVTRAAAGLPENAVTLAANYGEAGALEAARRRGHPVPAVVSPHNGWWWWGPPPAEADHAIVIGDWDDAELEQLFATCEIVARVDNGVDLDNEEQDAPVRRCFDLVTPWATMWPRLQRLG